MTSVRSLEPSSTTIISLRDQVWETAQRKQSAIQFSALNAGMRIETRGFTSFSSLEILRRLSASTPQRTWDPSAIEVACEIPLESASQIHDVPWPAQESRFAFDNLLAEGSHVRCDHGQTITVRQEEHAALEDLLVGKNQYIRRLEIEFHLFIRNELDPQGDLAWREVFLHRLLDFVPIRFGAILRFASENQPVIRVLTNKQAKSSEQVLDAFVRPDSAEKQNGLFILPEAQYLLGFGRSQDRIRESVVDRMADDRDLIFGNPKILTKLFLHFFGMDENVIAEEILNPKSEVIEKRVIAVAPCLIYVVSCKNDLLAQHFVVQHQESAVEELDLVVPQNMQNPGPGTSGVADKSRVVDHESPQLVHESAFLRLLSPKIKKSEIPSDVQLRAIYFISAYNVQRHAFRDKCHG